MTQKEIAKILNVSRSTVGLALLGKGKIKPATRKRIVEFAKKTNYQPNMAARSLVMQKTNLIGLLIHSLKSRFLCELSDEIYDCLSEKGYSVILGVGLKGDKYTKFINSMVSRNIEGIISYSADCDELTKLSEKGIPVVAYRRSINYPLSYVDVDRYKGGQMLVKHLIASGRHRIAFVGATNSINSQDQRFAGYQMAMLDNDLEVEESLIVNIEGEMQEGVEGMRILLEQSKNNPPDAVMFHNDSMAIAGMGEAIHSGIRVPEDMAIVGFDDIEEAKYSNPKLTTIIQPKKEIAVKLVDMLTEQIEEKDNNYIYKKHVFEPILSIRESSLNINKK